MFRCNLQGLGSAISGNLGGIFSKKILCTLRAKKIFVRYAPTDGGAPLRWSLIANWPPLSVWESQVCPPPPHPTSKILRTPLHKKTHLPS